VKKSANISDILSKESFWDIKFDQLNADRDRALIVPRALYFTTPQTFDRDIERLEKIYDKTEILKELKSTKEPLSNKLLALVANRYHVPVFNRFTHPRQTKKENRQLSHV
jgi:hypothetical protein